MWVEILCGGREYVKMGFHVFDFFYFFFIFIFLHVF